MPRNYDIAELRRLDVAHHLPAQADWQEIENLGGSRIITHAEGCYIHDGDGNRILDGMAGSAGGICWLGRAGLRRIWG